MGFIWFVRIREEGSATQKAKPRRSGERARRQAYSCLKFFGAWRIIRPSALEFPAFAQGSGETKRRAAAGSRYKKRTRHPNLPDAVVSNV